MVYVIIVKNICLSGGDNMITQQDYDGMQAATKLMLDRVNSMSDEEAESFITQWLIDTGALDEDGNEKVQIVNGDFFGW